MNTVSLISFLDYQEVTPDNIRAVHDHSGLTRPEAAILAGVSEDSYNGWLTTVTSSRYRKPMKTTWSHFLYELEARRIGFTSLADAFNTARMHAPAH